MSKQKPQFNKVAALDEFMQAMQLPPNPLMSDNLRVIIDSQNYLQKIHDDALELGFEKGCEATKTVDNL
jgi:hypothetical protein